MSIQNNHAGESVKKKRESDSLRSQIRRDKEKLTNTKREIEINSIKTPTTKSSLESNERCSIDYEINVRSILGAFMLGTAGTDVARLLTMIGIDGGPGFYKLFYRHQALVCSKFLSRS